MTNETLITEAGAEITGAAAESQAADNQVDTTGQPAAEQPKGDAPAGEKPAEQKPEGAPEQYEEFKFEEGKALSEDMAADVKAIAKELNLPQAQAQKLADLALRKADAAKAAQADALAAARTEWADATRADKEIGGDALPENLGAAKKALDAFGTPELRLMLNESGLGNHPEVIRFMVRAGKAMSEDRIVTGARQSVETDLAKRMFPNQA